jgi:hypothetical protein
MGGLGLIFENSIFKYFLFYYDKDNIIKMFLLEIILQCKYILVQSFLYFNFI